MNSDIQLSMPLIDHSSLNFAKGSTDVNTGEQVIYRGFVNGGPTSGTKGVIKRKYARKAIVDLGTLGTWNVPYFLLYPSIASETM